MAVISGGVTLAYPTLARWFSELSGIVLPVVLAGATTAIVATFYSYGAKERHRHWCLVGLALAALTFIVFD